MKTSDFIKFSAKKIKIDDEGKKKIIGLPVGWDKITKTSIQEGHKVLCVRTGKLNNITVIDFDSVKAYDKAIAKFPELKEFFTIKTPRGYHIYSKYNECIKTTTDKKLKIDIRNDGAFVFGSGSIREDGEQYTDLIQGDLTLELSDEIIKYVSKKSKKKKTITTPTIKEEKNELIKIKEICDTISTNILYEYDSWLKIIWAMRNCPDIDEDFARKISSKASNYTTEGFDAVYSSNKHGRDIKPATLYYYAKKSNSKKFYEIVRKHDRYICKETGVIDIADRFIELVGDNIVCDLNEELLIWNGNKWRVDKCGDLITNMIEDVMLPYYRGELQMILNEMETTTDKDLTEELENNKNAIEQVISDINSYNILQHISKTVRRKAKTSEQDILFNMLESQDNNLHFNNGVLNIVTEQFRPRDKYDYMTLSLSWDYETDDTKINTAITEDINSMFKKMDTDPIICDFMKSWLFYCLTGSTDLQKFLIQLGEDASNGKSTLFSIMNKCFEFYTYKLDSKVFDIGYAQSHKQFVTLITKPVRFAYIEELGSKQIDGQLVKDTTDGEINVNVMYKNSAVVKSQAKINVASNGIPNIKMDNGVKRRMKIKECKSQFLDGLDADDYENRKFMKDERILKKFECDEYKNAFLKVLLSYKTVTIPDELNNYTNEIQGECDPFKAALEEHFIITGLEDDRTCVAEIETTLKSGSYNPKTIKSNMRRIGYKVSINLYYNLKRGCYTGLRMKEDGE
jgi:hypothetical protein